MARPRKLGAIEMIGIVESYFESHGDPDKLKCSLLENYAVSMGFEVKAYDFRRTPDVRRRIEELRCLANTSGVAVIAYKSVDVDAFLSRNYTKEMLKISIIELDTAWRSVYERAAELSRKNTAMLSELASKERIIALLSAEKDDYEIQNKSLKRDIAALTHENRHLRKSIKEYLYPAIANEILKREHILEQTDTDVLPETMEALADNGVPIAFSSAVSTDRQELSREESILKRMEARIHGKSNATNTHD